MHHDGVGRLIDAFVPDILKNLVGRENTPRVTREQIENVKFDRRQANLLAVHRDLVIVAVDDEPAHRNLALFLRTYLFFAAPRIELRVAAQLALDARRELKRIKGLRDIVVGAGAETLDFVDIRALCREHDNRNISGLPDFCAHLEAVHARHHNVQQHELYLILV